MCDGKPEFDLVSKRIYWLTEKVLIHVADDESGWSGLFKDPQDGRLWERTFPESHRHGGGAPRLKLIDHEAAKDVYRI